MHNESDSLILWFWGLHGVFHLRIPRTIQNMAPMMMTANRMYSSKSMAFSLSNRIDECFDIDP